MLLAPTPVNEAQRLDSVLRLNLLHSEREERFDRITRIIHHLFDIPLVFISLIDDKNVWYKSTYGSESIDEPRDISFCGHTICNTVTNDLSSRFMEVIDAKNDERFFDNPFVTQQEGVRYYLGFVLQSPDQYNIGTLCMIDVRPRSFTKTQKKLFYDLGLMIEKELNKPRLENQYGKYTFEEEAINSHIDKVNNLNFKLELIRNQFNSSLANKNLNYKEWSILNEIIQSDFVSPKLLSKKLLISAPMMTRKLDTLESKRLIERWNSKEGDRRLVHIKCTKLGESIWKKGSKEIERLSEIYLKNLVFLN